MKYTVKLFAIALSVYAPAALSATDFLSAGVYNQKTGDSLQAICLNWETHDQTRVCTSIQFVETVNGQLKNIGGIIKNGTASDLALPKGAPQPYRASSNLFPSDPFEFTKKTWGDSDAALGVGITAGSLTAAGLAVGAPIVANNPGASNPGKLHAPQAPNNDALSEALPTANAVITVYTINLNSVSGASGFYETPNFSYVNYTIPNLTPFFNLASPLAPEQRVADFNSLYFSGNSGSSINLTSLIESANTNIPISNVTLTRIELVKGQYLAVIVPNAELSTYWNYIQTTTNTNNSNYQAALAAYNKALALYPQEKALFKKAQRKALTEYCSAVVGGSLLILAAPTIADLIRDACAYPIYEIASRRANRRNKKISTEWVNAWNTLIEDHSPSAVGVPDPVFQAMISAIAKSH